MANITITPAGAAFNPTDTVTSTRLNEARNPTAALVPASVVPSDLSLGAPSWDGGGTLNVIGSLSSSSIFTSGEAIEINQSGTGDRNAYVDFHTADSSGTDFNARIFRKPGVNADLEIINSGTGAVVISSSIDQINSNSNSITTKAYVDEYAMKYSGSTGTFSTTAATFVDLDLSSIVGSNRALVILEVYDCSRANSIFYRTKGSTLVPYAGNTNSGWGAASGTLGTSDNGGTVVVMTDENGIMQHRADYTATGVKYTIQAFQKLLIPTP
jgi:hypothetical protein